MSLNPSTRLRGYEVRRQLGVGGMGVVYLAQDLTLGRTVAIKVLSGEFSNDSQRTRRFEQEARAASALNHPNVCVVHALGETDDGQPFIAMEYIEGLTLRRILQTRPLSLRGTLDIAIQVAAGVGAAHALGIVHRDLKPENVIVRDDGLVKVVDFGLAKLAAGRLPSDFSEATHTLLQTDAGVVMGTFTYMAPEQARGVEVDARADIWALGVMLYEMASGHAPFTGETRSDVLAAILEREPPPLDRIDPRIPHELQRIVTKALRKDRAQRYQTVPDLRLDLEALRSELQASSSEVGAASAAPAAQVSAQPPTRRESSAEFLLSSLVRHRIAAAAALGALVIAVVFAAWWVVRQSPIPRTVTREAAPQVQRNLTRVTFGEGLQDDPTFSPDGRFIAYASDRAGNFDIWVQPVTGGDPVQVTKSTAQDTQPDWSPDGSTIAFRSERDGGGLYVVPALGGPERKLTSIGQYPKWSLDGATLSFLEGPSLDSGEGPARFFSVALDGSAPRELGSKFLAGGTWRWIARHPDGRISAIGTHPQRGLGFFTFAEDGGRVVTSTLPAQPALVAQNAFDRIRFQWNTTGTRLYLEATLNALENLWRVQIDPQTLDWRSVERLTTDPASDVAAALSRDESRLAFTQRHVSMSIWAFPFDASAGRLVGATGGRNGEGKPISDPGGAPGAFSLSPDGNLVAYALTRAGTASSDLWVTHIDSSKAELLVTNGFASSWSPDGRRLAYAKFQKGKEALFVRELGGHEERQISSWSTARQLLPQCWTSDGSAILVTALDNTHAPFWLWPAGGGNDKPARVLLEQPGTNFWQGQLSPNGRWLAFVPENLADPGRGRLAIAPADGAPPDRWTHIAPDSPWVDKPRWAPDGRTLYFIAKGPSGFFDLIGLRFDPDRGMPIGAPFALTHFDSPSQFLSPYVNRSEIGIAAHRAVLTIMSISGSVWMLDGIDR